MKLLLFAAPALLPLLVMCCAYAGSGSSAAAQEKPAAPAKETAQRELEALLEPIRAQHDLPALAAAVIREDKIVAVGAVGVRKVGSDARVTVNDQFHLGSCTKSMTATLIAMLVEHGELHWDTTLAEAFPELWEEMRPEYRAVTIEQLLLHRGGLPSESWPAGKTFADMHHLPGTPREQRAAYAGMMLRQAPEARPGTKFIYSNAGYAIAGVIAERTLDTPWETLMQKLLFKPLGMKTAGFGAMGKPGKIEQPWQHVIENGKPHPVEPGPMSDNPPAIGPAGTVHCSLGDWAKYILAHLRGEREGGLVSAATFQKLHTPPSGGDYALGWLVTTRDWAGGRALTHAGSNTMNFAVVWMAPEKQFAVLVATNQGGDAAAKACDQAAGDIIGKYLTGSKK